MRIATMTSNRIARTVVVYANNYNPREISFIVYTHDSFRSTIFLLQLGLKGLRLYFLITKIVSY